MAECSCASWVNTNSYCFLLQGHLAILQLKGTPGNPALLETMSCQFPNPVSLFKEIRKLKVKENLGKFSELLLNKVLLGLKIFGKWVLEAIKEE